MSLHFYSAKKNEVQNASRAIKNYLTKERAMTYIKIGTKKRAKILKK
ncbi:hypothetical protein UNSWCS_2126 [Campylobacter concisus UNSWCS]|uniref:Uncharacterized protein n=1 Tax=Campylobacter concisus UNSWCS TaxID=1242968 RepID=U2F664_9BACT|nr:hypothetical protein UNSWCS_2126 [Campylobacter concisus UNSWCS]